MLQEKSSDAADIWDAVKHYLAMRKVTRDEFSRRHRLHRRFLDDLEAGTAKPSPAAKSRLLRIVRFGPDLRSRRESLRIGLRELQKTTEISLPRLSRAERLLGELTNSEKTKIDQFLVRKKRLNEKAQAQADQKTLAASLKRQRRKVGLTHKQLAALIARERKTIGRWEATGAIPKMEQQRLDARLPGWRVDP